MERLYHVSFPVGEGMPRACMSVLVVYCLRGIDPAAGTHGVPELLCAAAAALLHCWKRNTLLSICVSTALYMLLVQNL